MKICVIGAGYVGLTTAACFAHLGNEVICVDNNPDRIRLLEKGQVPFYEPYLEEVVGRHLSGGVLSFATDLERGLETSEILFIAVPTPSSAQGEVDFQYLAAVARGIGQSLNSSKLVVNRSTVPPGTTQKLATVIGEELEKRNTSNLLELAVNPEFLREGMALHDFLCPSRIVIGASNHRAVDLLLQLYHPIIHQTFDLPLPSPGNMTRTLPPIPVLVTDVATAEMIKYAANAFLSLKVSFINEVGNMCKELGIDVYQVAQGIGFDPRIAPHFLQAGLGFGGSCLPKDTRALAALARSLGQEPHLLEAVLEVNRNQPLRMVELARRRLGGLKGKRLGILGLAFKPDTDDMREASSIPLVEELLREGVSLFVYDPRAMPHARGYFGDRVSYEKSAREVVDKAECLLVVTEWVEFKDPELYRGKTVIFGRRVLPLEEGRDYEGICW